MCRHGDAEHRHAKVVTSGFSRSKIGHFEPIDVMQQSSRPRPKGLREARREHTAAGGGRHECFAYSRHATAALTEATLLPWQRLRE
jgi:hypothetical protein